MEDEIMNLHNRIIKHIEDALATDYAFGTNDCNIVALRIVDEIKGTNWSQLASYTSLKEGVAQLKAAGFESTQDIIRQECQEVKIPIDGDIWLDPENPLIIGVVVSGRMLGINDDHSAFELIYKKKTGKFYRSVKNG
ncbi:ornithine carbamoyltransferase [Escherichia coli]|nr:ornithine carbamoyltransferase [Escherichia coli]MEC9706016.1 ornithine carbamoyltransferase [Escherichia marmotae]